MERLAPNLLSHKPAGLGQEQWSSDSITLQTYSSDLWPRKLLELREQGPPTIEVDLVIWPQTVEEVTQVVHWANEADVSLIPYGAGSGVCGATVPSDLDKRPRVIVDLKRMRKVREVDPISQTVVAEAGLIGENLERHLNQENFTLGHFPSSIYCSSLGGYLATRSAGQLSTKYGKIEDMVLSLECVLADGTILETARAPRSAMGPDWTQILLGSEGTLAFLTAARLQIHELPETRMKLGFGADSIEQAMEFARKLMQRDLRPSVLRIYDPQETSLTIPSETFQKNGFSSGCAIVVIFEGSTVMVESETKVANQIAGQVGVVALGSDLGEHWWKHRYDVSYKQQLILSHERVILDTFEIAATWDRLPEVYRAVKGAEKGMGMILAHLSHFYHTGANIYFTLVSHTGFKKDSVSHYDAVWKSMMGAALDAGATLSHHHGVGTLKNQWIQKEKKEWQEIYKKVKNGFDPQNRFNPYKMGL